MKDDLVLRRGKRGLKQIPAKLHLMIFLHFMGKEGESNSTKQIVFNISQGKCELHRKCVVKAY